MLYTHTVNRHTRAEGQGSVASQSQSQSLWVFGRRLTRSRRGLELVAHVDEIDELGMQVRVSRDGRRPSLHNHLHTYTSDKEM